MLSPRSSKSFAAGATLVLGFANHMFHERNRYLLEIHKINMFYQTQIEMYKISLNNKSSLNPPSPPDMLPSPFENIVIPFPFGNIIIPPLSIENMNLHEIIINTAQWLDLFILSSLFFLICFVILYLLSSKILFDFFISKLELLPWPNVKRWLKKIVNFRRFVNEILRVILLLAIVGIVYHCYLFCLILIKYMELGHFVENLPELAEYLKKS